MINAGAQDEHLNNNDFENRKLQIERLERVYTFLEFTALNEAKYFSKHDKAALRRAQADLQRVRLWLYDVTGMQPVK